ncbi:MAG: FHA domain-containing protein [Deltaproteobacteria bacterium]|nr:FHA domain-containing protein [Deltaproteobacteria bacterium]
MAISSKSEEQENNIKSESNKEDLELENETENRDESNGEKDENNSSEKSKKKSKTSKKTKSASLSDEESNLEIDLNPYQLNKTLVKESSTIKSEMELLENRLEKMYEHKENVSEDVFKKVKGDYEAQLDKVRESFEEKCQKLEEELEKLYELKDEQKAILTHHESILEEAKFRHLLEEFSDEDFKNEQKVQNKEIKKYSTILETIQSSIQKYEDILGRPYAPKEQSFKEEEIESIEEEIASQEELLNLDKEQAPQTDETPAQVNAKMEETPPMGISESEILESFTEEESTFQPVQPEEISQEYDDLLEIGGDYFGEEEKIQTTPQTAEPQNEELEADESISNILKDIPFEEEENEIEIHIEEPTGDLAASSPTGQEASEASLLLIEGTLDDHEFILGESTTMGRSPSNDVVLKESRISRQHANITKTDEGYVIVDLKSSNGILVNDQKVEEALLQDGDEIQVGGFRFQFNIL